MAKNGRDITSRIPTLVSGRRHSTSTLSNSATIAAQGGVALSGAAATMGPRYSWLLDEQYVEPRTKDLVIVCPRPDSETGVTSSDTVAKYAHSLAMPGRKYRMPIGVSWGSPPYHVELISGPTGMYIETPPDDQRPNYAGWLVWPVAVAGSHSVTLRVYDQQYSRTSNPSTYVDRTFTINCNASLFVVLQAGSGGFESFEDIHLNDEDNDDYKNLAVWIRGAGVTYMFSAPGGADEMSVDKKPKIWLSDPDEISEIDFTHGQFSVGNRDQTCFNFHVAKNSCQTLPDSHFIFFGGFAQARSVILIRKMHNIRRGTATQGDNPAGVTLFSPGDYVREHFYMGHTEITNNTAPAIDCYGVSGLIENIFGHDNVLSAGGEGQIVFPKGGNVDMCIRGVKARNIAGRNAVYVFGGVIDAGPQRDIEVSYCDLLMVDSFAIAINTNNAGPEGPATPVRNIYIKRCTITGTIDQSNTHYNEILVRSCVVVSNDSIPIVQTDGNRHVTVENCVTGNTSAGILDSDNRLQGTYRTTYLGKVGNELPLPPATIAFEDDFSSGDFDKTDGNFSWAGRYYASVISGFGPSGKTHCVEFDFTDERPDLRFLLGNLHPDVYLRFYLYFPSGTESPSRGPRWARSTGNANNKLFRLFGLDDLQDAGSERYPRVGASSYPSLPSGDEYARGEAGIGPEEGNTSPVGDNIMPWVDNASRGTWIKFEIHARASTVGDNGRLEFWVNGLPRGSVALNTNLLNDAVAGFGGGYLFGWQNGPNDTAGSKAYMGDFAISYEGRV